MLWKECEALQTELVTMRRDLHRIPEVGMDLPKTAAYIAGKLDEYGIPYTKNEGDSGLIATIGSGGRTVVLRADIDALPIAEETGVEYASCHPGYMHACGHDAHAAMLLGAAKVLKAHEAELKGTVRLIFQTAEELGQGARVMLRNGAVEGADAIFGTHIGNLIDKTIPSGTFMVTPGPAMASFDRFIITVTGHGCHGSTPEKGVDPVNIQAHVVLALQAINAREFGANVPVVVTIGSVHGGSQYNVIPDQVVMEGTFRTLDEAVRQKVARRIEAIAAGTAAAFGGSAETEIVWGAPPVVNDDAMAAFAAGCAKEVLGEDKVITRLPSPNMGGEDFACYLQEIPGAFMFLSSSDADLGTDVPHHNAKFNVDEHVLWEGTAVFTAIAEKFLSK